MHIGIDVKELTRPFTCYHCGVRDQTYRKVTHEGYPKSRILCIPCIVDCLYFDPDIEWIFGLREWEKEK